MILLSKYSDNTSKERHYPFEEIPQPKGMSWSLYSEREERTGWIILLLKGNSCCPTPGWDAGKTGLHVAPPSATVLS